MKYYKSIFLLLIAPLLLSGVVKKNRNPDNTIENKKNETMSNVKGVTLTNSIGTAIIVNKQFKGSILSAYEVRFTFTGYTLFYGTPSDCPIRTNGKVVLAGLLEGAENVSSDDDISYSGTLQLDIDIDICSAKGEGDNSKLCGITVTGSGPVKTELEIYYDGRGGYIQIKDTTSRGFRKNAVGTCDLAEIAEERTMIPLKTIANVFNGLDLPMLTQRTLRVRRYVKSTDQGEIVIEVLRKVR